MSRTSSAGKLPLSVVLLLAVLAACGGIRLLPEIAEGGDRLVPLLVGCIIFGLVIVPMLPKRKRRRRTSDTKEK